MFDYLECELNLFQTGESPLGLRLDQPAQPRLRASCAAQGWEDGATHAHSVLVLGGAKAPGHFWSW